MEILRDSTRVIRPLLLTTAVALVASSGAALSQDDRTVEVDVACDDGQARDRSRSTRRRGTAANRDCEYRETVVDEETGEVLRETPVAAAPRTVLPRRYSSIPRPTAEQYVEHVPIPDRWRIVDSLGYADNWWDPYNQNTIKGDKPIHDDWFFNVIAISDTVVELREVATPVGVQSTDRAGTLDVLG